MGNGDESAWLSCDMRRDKALALAGRKIPRNRLFLEVINTELANARVGAEGQKGQKWIVGSQLYTLSSGGLRRWNSVVA